jgi:glycosyltransferase involved in cell wall biosynthesis
MRIAVWHNLASGGAKRALYGQVRGLVSRGHEVEVWCPTTADRSYLPLRDIVPEHVVPLAGFEPHTHPPKSKIRQHLRWNRWTKLRAMERHSLDCARQINAGKFDLLFGAGCIFYQTPFIGRYVDLPSVLYLQEPTRWFYEALPELPWPALDWTGKDLLTVRFWRRALLHRIQLSAIRLAAREERINAQAFDQILVNSQFSRESVLRAFGISAKVCYLGVDTDKFVNLKKQRECSAVFVGALVPAKNVEFLVEALGTVEVSLRPKLVLIANTISRPYLDRIHVLAERLGVVLDLKCGISDEEIIDILNRSKMMLYAPRLEPFGYAPLEANACGLPVIGVAEGGVRETIQDGVNGLLVDHEPESMSAAIKRLMMDHELHRSLSAQAEHLAKTDWSLGPSIVRLERCLQKHAGKVSMDSKPVTRTGTLIPEVGSEQACTQREQKNSRLELNPTAITPLSATS